MERETKLVDMNGERARREVSCGRVVGVEVVAEAEAGMVVTEPAVVERRGKAGKISDWNENVSRGETVGGKG